VRKHWQPWQIPQKACRKADIGALRFLKVSDGYAEKRFVKGEFDYYQADYKNSGVV